MKFHTYQHGANKNSFIPRNETINRKSAGASFQDNREETRIQKNFASMANGGTVFQLKRRIDWDNLPDKVNKENLRERVNTLRETRHKNKLELTKAWVRSIGKGEGRDNTYNDEIAKVRKQYEESLAQLAEEQGVDKQYLISDDKYYGEEVEGSSVYRRSDVGKEYVKDNRGTFVPRYIRRELNHQDDLGGDSISTKGIKTHGKLKREKGLGSGGSAEITWPEREFLQQSIGGGSNLFALSHSSTKRPILSNAHDSFGAEPDLHAHSGAIITDLAQLGDKKFSAQWAIHPVFGHKVPLDVGVHSTLDKWSIKDRATKPGTGLSRDEKVRSSGYRNMEVVAEGIPHAAHIQPNDSWKTHEGPKTDYHEGSSKRGEELLAYRKQRQQEVLEQIKVEKEQKESDKAVILASQMDDTGKEDQLVKGLS